ncbi:hypothetical protein BN874_200011 [Candidatus Contendobacter odensis Run_B_J11]|uniref:Uncharacterized protein n=1 Tax=Candidatus Contendobacter odensis Run_B_J11 TaxID=1400861 RepID=A0A7U7J3U2_9GAMM|nr:hypothetical protein BN874_200011 [Candidatus Contendobacter odensis Run_B_J11]
MATGFHWYDTGCLPGESPVIKIYFQLQRFIPAIIPAISGDTRSAKGLGTIPRTQGVR